MGKIKTTPIWHFILDYDGYANSDKRYRTKYHDDIPELEEKFADAVNLSLHSSDSDIYKKEYLKFERLINEREKFEGLIGFKRMTLLEAFRRMASIEGWCFYFRDKNIIFEPCTPPKDSGVVLTDKEILSGTYTK